MSSLSINDELARFSAALFTSPEEGVALVLSAEQGSVLLTSQYGSNIAAYPLRSSNAEDPAESGKKLLKAKGFTPALLPRQNSPEFLASVMQKAGFSLSQVHQAFRLC